MDAATRFKHEQAMGIGKLWTEMSREEKLLTMEVFQEELDDLAATLVREFNEILIKGKTTLRVECKAYVVVDVNDDPRLP